MKTIKKKETKQKYSLWLALRPKMMCLSQRTCLLKHDPKIQSSNAATQNMQVIKFSLPFMGRQKGNFYIFLSVAKPFLLYL